MWHVKEHCFAVHGRGRQRERLQKERRVNFVVVDVSQQPDVVLQSPCSERHNSEMTQKALVINIAPRFGYYSERQVTSQLVLNIFGSFHVRVGGSTPYNAATCGVSYTVGVAAAPPTLRFAPPTFALPYQLFLDLVVFWLQNSGVST